MLLNTIIEHYEADSSHQPIQKRKNCAVIPETNFTVKFRIRTYLILPPRSKQNRQSRDVSGPNTYYSPTHKLYVKLWQSIARYNIREFLGYFDVCFVVEGNLGFVAATGRFRVQVSPSPTSHRSFKLNSGIPRS